MNTINEMKLNKKTIRTLEIVRTAAAILFILNLIWMFITALRYTGII